MTTPHREPARALLALLTALGMVYAPVWTPRAGAQEGDDIFLLTVAAAPNVVLLLDNSTSMNHIEWHPAFDPDAGSYGCSDFDNTRVYEHTEITSARCSTASTTTRRWPTIPST